MADRIGEIIGNYRVESLLGAGGMGQVFLGVHRHLERRAAIKVMHAHLAADPGFQARFVREARAAAALSHPHIVEIYDFGEQDGLFYLVMELMPDGSLGTLLRPPDASASQLGLREGVSLVLQATQGLAFAHAQGVVHRDVKPDNLLLKRGGDATGDAYLVKVCDFGLARLAESAAATSAGLMMGTPAYMSPEQCQGLTLDSRSDQYSLGVVLYEVVTGQRPFTARTPTEAIQQHVYDAPPSSRAARPDLSPELDAIIARCLAKHPDGRFPTTDALVEALRGALAALDATLPPQASLTVTPEAANYAAARALEGRQLNRYRVDALRSAAPLTWDYVGQQLILERSVILKVLRPELARDPLVLEHFQSDARLAARVRHPGLVEVLDTGAAEGFSFVALDAVEGTTLRQRLDQGRLTSGEALRYLRQTAEALDYAHSQGVKQLDLQPQSVMVRPDGSVALLDFGDLSLAAERARATHTPSAAREAYVSPERASGALPEASGDIYALGCLAYELLSGKPPFMGQQSSAPLGEGLSDPQIGLRLDAPGLSPLVSTVIARALDRNPEDRYATADEFVRVLASALPDPDGVTDRIAQSAVRPAVEAPAPDASQVSREVVAASGWPVVTDPAVTAPSVALAPAALVSESVPASVPPAAPPPVATMGGAPVPAASARGRWPLAVLALAGVLVIAAVLLLNRGGSGKGSATATTALGGGATATSVAVVVATNPTATQGVTATATTDAASATAYTAALASATAQVAPTATPTEPPTATASPTVAVTPTYDWFAAERAGLIAFVSGRRPDNANIPDIYVMNADGTDQRRLLTISAADAYPSSDPAWSHDGHQLAFTSSRDGNDEIYVMNVDGSGLNDLTHTQAADNSADWWSDDSMLAFQSNRDGNFEIYTMQADGSNQTNLTNSPGTDWGPKWSPAGDQIVFVSDRNGANQIWVMQYDGSNQHALTSVDGAQDYNPTWSPDQRQIAFARDTGSGFDIFVMNADGSDVRQLTDNPAQDGTPTWSPDGNTILFRSDRDGNPEVYSMRSDGTDQKRLTDNPTYDGSPIYAPAGG